MTPRVYLSEVAQINPRLPRGANEEQEVSFLAMASISEDGKVLGQETRILGETKKGYTYFERGDILLAKITPCFENGKAALVYDLEHPIGFGSTEFHVLRPDTERLNAQYLFYLLWSDRFRFLGQKVMKGAAGHKRVPADFLSNFEIPLPSLEDQARIANLFGKVDVLIAQRKQSLCELDELLKSVFLDMFGDPVRNEKGWHVQNCDKAVLDISSGTSYGGEDRAFVGPDEVGVLKISAVTKGSFDPEEYKVVNPAQITKSLRFVKRGDFLFSRANTVGLVAACCIVPQDYTRLFLPDKLWVLSLNAELVTPQFFNYLLKNARYRSIVRNLASGGHDSMLNISMKKFMTLGIPCPPIDLQNQFSVIVEKIEGIKSRYQQGLADLQTLYRTLIQKLFMGELDLSRLPMPSIEPKEDKSVVTEPLQAHSEEGFAIHLPDSDNLRDALHNPQAREALIAQWLEVYSDQIDEIPFSVERFMRAAQARLADFHPDDDFELDAKDYESIKTWVFEALANGRLKQSRDITGHDKKGKPIFGNRIQLKAGQA
ncbi:restriction endonuclease subunit S [Pseudomonas monsensis]|uniref:Restriction endonuclease subunit S n=1 Tax=Pseudomonas monsensis TaxID=2745509 RepID=A0ABT3YWB0_9PSED|nr:restriction endonuclease subunit S [Pseudomonas monsensis]MCY0109781.1 restriction endonuclease subunit S [Pseudomonas monsensis]